MDYHCTAGSTPLIISLPHVGTAIPDGIAARLTAAGRAVADTDWHVQHLYGFARDAGASWLQAHWSRYVVDLNRPPDDAALYADQVATGLCPTLSFAGELLYAGALPDAAERSARRDRYWTPYHARLRELIDTAHARHGYALLLDAHSIRSAVPRLFAGRLPDINLGSNTGRSCAAGLVGPVLQRLAHQTRFSHVLDGRFTGGHITRAYGDPAGAVHALQIELAQQAYMDERSCAYEALRAAPLIALLRELVEALLSFRP